VGCFWVFEWTSLRYFEIYGLNGAAELLLLWVNMKPSGFLSGATHHVTTPALKRQPTISGSHIKIQQSPGAPGKNLQP
jgi:hypothetical protein